MTQRIRMIVVSVVMLAVVSSVQLFGQSPIKGVRIGAEGGVLRGHTDKPDNELSAAIKFFLRHDICDNFDGDASFTYGGIRGTLDAPYNYQVDLWLADYKILYKPFIIEEIEPYVGLGIGLGFYDVNTSCNYSNVWKRSGYVGYIPMTVGLEYPIAENFQLDANLSFNYSFSDAIVTKTNPASQGGGLNDAWWGVFAGASYTIFQSDNDGDNDGLLKSEEEQLGTDPKNPDSDGDGLLDGEEINKYHTSPLKQDSDGDGLSDKDEVAINNTDPNKADTDGDGLSDSEEVQKYMTDPLKVDTDGDWLNDGDEVNKYKTDPLKADTDGDGISDKDEVLVNKTDPLKADTDGDGLSDGDEVVKYKTDPLKADTDGDGISDGVEVKNGTNPLDPNDPKRKKSEPVAFKSEVGKAIVLEGVVFKTGSSTLTSASNSILTSALKTMVENPELEVQIQGFTDNVGNAASNLRLSQKRANSVKAWLVKKGVNAKRITTKGFGPKNPIGDNSTAEGRQMNRRIEFFRTK